MKKPNEKREKRFPFAHRFLTGLVIALSLTLTAFEWTTYTINTYEPETGDPIVIDDEILPPIRFRIEEVKPPQKENKGDGLEIVKEILKPVEPEVKPKDEPKDEPTEPAEPGPEPINPNDYGMDDDTLPYENEIHSIVEVFAHYDKCAGLYNAELKKCSLEDLSYKISKSFVVSDILKDIGGRQAAFMTFVIDEKGNIHSIEAIESSSKAMTKDAIKAIKKLPKLNPAMQQGRAVSLRMKIPIRVTIRD